MGGPSFFVCEKRPEAATGISLQRGEGFANDSSSPLLARASRGRLPVVPSWTSAPCQTCLRAGASMAFHPRLVTPEQEVGTMSHWRNCFPLTLWCSCA